MGLMVAPLVSRSMTMGMRVSPTAAPGTIMEPSPITRAVANP